MNTNQSELVTQLIGNPHSDGGWGKDRSKSSLTVTSEVLLALCDHFAQQPVVVTPDELAQMEHADTVLAAANDFIVSQIKTRAAANALDAPNCALGLAAYLSFRGHAARRNNSWQAIDPAFIKACAEKASAQSSWLNGKAGATWACVKAVALVDHYVAEGRDSQAIEALKKSDIETFRSHLKTRVVDLLADRQGGEPVVYNASVLLDLTVSIRTWLENWISSETINAAQNSALVAIYNAIQPLYTRSPFAFDIFRGTSADEQYYQVVAPAALLTSIDVLMRRGEIPATQADFWSSLLYLLAARMSSPAHFDGKPPYVLAHYARALAASQLREREVAVVAKQFREAGTLRDEITTLIAMNQVLPQITARIGAPGQNVFLAASNIVFMFGTASLTILFFLIIIFSHPGSVASIIGALGVVLSLSPLHFLIWALKEKTRDKPKEQRLLSIFQYFVVGGWIALPIFVAFIISWFKNVSTGIFGH